MERREKEWESSIEAWGMSREGRSLGDYEKQLFFNRNDLEGKKVLDLGAGPKNKLREDIAREGINADVISLSPDFSNPKYSSAVRAASPDGKIVAGLGQELPFLNESFDYILALHLLEHFSSEDAFKNIIREIARILKPGGIAKMGPTEDIPYPPLSPYKLLIDDENLIKDLLRHNVELSKEDVPLDVLPTTKVKNRYGDAFYVPRYEIVLKKHKREEKNDES